MTSSQQRLAPYLQQFDFNDLFIEGLGWDHYDTPPVTITVDEFNYELKPVAQKRGFAVFTCSPDAEGSIPRHPTRRKLENRLTKTNYENLIIFLDELQSCQLWQRVKRTDSKPTATFTHRYTKGQQGTALLQHLQSMVFTLDEEADTTLTDVGRKVASALDIEKVTKRFYDRFQKELKSFQEFINGINNLTQRDWYASLTLNRLMLVYFIQKQGFLNSDPNYLSNKLQEIQKQNAGKTDRFHQFYRLFLLRLFHEGLGQPEAQRDPDLAHLLGQVPFLNGGLFDVHELERNYQEISIPDAAFEQIFRFFNSYQWHLDQRPTGSENEINPDVLGYIFEKYINQKQTGAYYTKEDITGYIARNTILPKVLAAAATECPIAFAPHAGVWRLLAENPDRYIYPAVGHGISWHYSPEAPARLNEPIEPIELPPEITSGIADPGRRQNWNHPAPPDYALPSETWREVIHRRQRYADLTRQMTAGTIHSADDLTTLNLDIETFVLDAITYAEGPELLRAFWKSLNQISILDPACGSGAFLFAALNILQPLYQACLDGMQGFIDDLERSDRPRSPQALHDFKVAQAQLQKHPNQDYYILKSIILNNLYGVDLMAEAVEICKLRLFLKLAAQLESAHQVEPLPDVDFNVKAGNTLVGFTSLAALRQAMTATPSGQAHALDETQQAALAEIEAQADAASQAYEQFRHQQTTIGGQATTREKTQLEDSLTALRAQLNRHLAQQYDISPQNAPAYAAWQNSHQPFHWFVEFNKIAARGGFDVAIGNPPYVEYKNIKDTYTIKGYEAEKCGNLWAFFMERANALTNQNTYLGMITPIAITSTKRMQPLRRILGANSLHTTSFADRPSGLFSGVHQMLTITIAGKCKQPETHSAGFHHWKSEERDTLLSQLAYSPLPSMESDIWLKIASSCEAGILAKITQNKSSIADYFQETGKVLSICGGTGGYWLRAFDEVASSKKYKTYYVAEEHCLSLCAALNSSTFYWFWRATSDCRDLMLQELIHFKLDLNPGLTPSLAQAGTDYLQALKSTREFRAGAMSYDQYRPAQAKPQADAIDQILARHYGFTPEELDYIINYHIKYRMGY